MRPLPEIRSRTQINNTNGVEPRSSSPDSNQRLTNGPLKEPIVTRSKSVKLKLRRRPSRSPLKAQSPAKNYTSDSSNGSHRKKEKTCSSGTSSSTKHQGGRRDKEDNDVNVRSKGEGVYARHYKSYRRSGLSSSLKVTADLDGNFASQNSERSLNSRRLRPYTNHGVKNSTGSSLRSGVSYKSRASAIEKRKKIGNLMSKNRGRPKKLVSSNSSSTTVTPLSSPTSSPQFTSDSHPDGSNKDKGAKRRSALWVLNCEAEEFLFGETAADKHELELPPSTDSSADSPPPKKRRRWRETELSHLLQTSPFLESKLRSCSSSSESGRDSFNVSPPPKIRKFRTEERPGRPAGKGKPRLPFPPESPPKCSSSKPISAIRVDNVPVIKNFELLSPTSSIRSNCSTFRDPPFSDLKTVQVREMLSSMPWRFSFEDPPVDESWYSTFSRPGDAIMSYTSFLPTYFEPVVLPYEMDRPFRRSRVKIPKNSRKSPRCHASTLAILSSEISLEITTTRSTRNSINTESASTPVAQAVYTAVPPETSLDSLISNPQAIPASTTAGSQPGTSRSSVSPITKFMRENCIPLRSKSPNAAKERARLHPGKRQDLSAQQYLWDSIQFLSDPYVVALLSGDESEAEFLPFTSAITSKTRSRQNSSYNGASNGNTIVCPVKKLVQNFEALERKASLRSCDGGSTNAPGASSAGKEGSAMANGTKVVPVPKASPRNHSHGTNHVNGTSVSGSQSSIRLLSVNGISKSLENRSPKSPTSDHRAHINGKSSNHTNGKPSKASKSNLNNKSPPLSEPRSRSKPGSPTEMDEIGRRCKGKPSTRRSPVVMVSDIFKNGKTIKTNTKKLILEEELLFLGDGLPPLPSWPV